MASLIQFFLFDIVYHLVGCQVLDAVTGMDQIPYICGRDFEQRRTDFHNCTGSGCCQRNTFPAPVCWWTDCTELGAYFLARSDEENQRLCKAAEQRLGINLSSVRPLHQEILEAYGDQIRDPRTLLSVLRSNKAYDAIKAPMVKAAGQPGYVIDKDSRAFQEDVAYGLAVLVEMGRRLNVPLPHIQEIFDWNVGYMQGLRGSALDYFPSTWPA